MRQYRAPVYTFRTKFDSVFNQGYRGHEFEVDFRKLGAKFRDNDKVPKGRKAKERTGAHPQEKNAKDNPPAHEVDLSDVRKVLSQHQDVDRAVD